MPVLNSLADTMDEIAEWRRDIHAHPELGFDVHRTAGVVAEKLRAFGADEVIEGVGRTGVVGVIRGRGNGSGRVIGLRADMDALPISEARDLPYKSTVEGKMHACGHDGHTAMLLGAARHLAESRNFDGTAVVIFQPAEEGGGGGEKMVEDGLMERWGIQEVYGMHNAPGRPVGSFALRPGPLMAAVDTIYLEVEGVGGHAARPHGCNDPIIASTHLVQALQTIVSRNADPLASAVVSITMIHGGDTDNVIPQTVSLTGSVRTLTDEMQALVERRIGEVCRGIEAMFGVRVGLTYERGYPVTRNDPGRTAFAAEVAAEIVGPENVDAEAEPVMGAEDFSYMLNARPGAFIFVGQGDTAGLHHPDYDFNDEIIPIGCSYWVRLVETAMPVG